MQLQQEDSRDSAGGAGCPYLGLLKDPDSCFGFAHPANCCHKVDYPEQVHLHQQSLVCLNEAFASCPVYRSRAMIRLPRNFRGRTSKPPWRADWRNSSWLFFASFLVLILALLMVRGLQGVAVLSAGLDEGAAREAALETIVSGQWATLTAEPGIVPGVGATPTVSSFPFVSPRYTPIAGSKSTATATPSTQVPTTTEVINTPTAIIYTPGPEMETLFGQSSELPLSGPFLLHLVSDDETLEKLALNYHTSEGVLKAINTELSSSDLQPQPGKDAGASLTEIAKLHPGMILVVSPGLKDPQRLPVFRVDHLQEQVLLEDYARSNAVSVDELRSYNDLGSGEWLPKGRWIIVPVTGITP